MVWREGASCRWFTGKNRGTAKTPFKEYRFDYPQARLELWEWHEGKGLLRNGRPICLNRSMTP